MDARFSLFLVMLTWSAASRAADPPRATPDSVRATMKQLWSNDGDEAANAVRSLEAEPLALPVVRRAHGSDPNPRHQGDLERLMAKLVARQDKVNAERVGKWCEGGRLDMLTEVRALTNGKAADSATEYLLRAAIELGVVSLALRSKTPPVRDEKIDPWVDGVWRAKDQMKLQFDTELTLPEKDTRQEQALFADRIDMKCADVKNSLVVCRSQLTHLTTTLGARKPGGVGRSQWQASVLFANTSVQLDVFGGCVVVDGDVELVLGAKLGAVIVANGHVREVVEGSGTYPYKTVVWAAGDITITPHPKSIESMFYAGGKVANAEKLGKGCVEENVKEPPFAVRFLDPAEFGLTLDATKEGMKVAKVADKSAFADAGLKTGDVIAKVGEVATATAPAFRREFRRGVIEGAVLLDVIRGKEKVELLVAVPDVPAVAKKKDDVKTPPPEKK